MPLRQFTMIFGVAGNRLRKKFGFLHKIGGLCLLTLSLSIFAPLFLGAQNNTPLSNVRIRVLDARLPEQKLDSVTIMPPLLTATDSSTGTSIDLSFFLLENNVLRIDTAGLRQNFPDCRRIKVRYRFLPFNLEMPVVRLDTAAIRRAGRNNDIDFDYSPYEPERNPWESAGLNSSGAYTRGLSFGNSQNLVFNSNLNLQLAGKLGNDLEIQGVLSDNSIPLQPDGTTRQLQEFDRIFIKIKRKNASLIAGDFDLAKPSDSYFANYFKRLQGGMAELKLSDVNLNSAGLKKQFAGDSLTLRFAAGVSKGKFSRQTINGQEGNQGPYRLQGAEGERFIIVLAGTEKVFIDGQLLRRGLSDDYTIDYNLGEISFTPRRLITKDSRLIVEFEYAVQSYLRSTVAATTLWNHKNTRVYFNVYSEQDSRNNSSAENLTDAKRHILALAGDDLRSAYASGVDTLKEFDAGRVLYKYVDTIACGVSTRALAYTTNVDSGRYAARFTEVPSGTGNYIQILSAANGRVYRWVAPDPVSCQPKGNFEPVVRLIAPELRQLYTVGAIVKPTKNGTLQVETALSNRDYNRLSPLGDGNNFGGAGFVNYRQSLLGEKNKTGWRVLLNGDFEYTSKTFSPLNPYRPAEFVRDWNVGSSTDTAAEQIARAGLTVQKQNWGSVQYNFGAFSRQAVYEGRRNVGQIKFLRNGYELSAEANLLETNGRVERTRFSRPKFELAKTLLSRQSKLPLLKIGLYGERERNERHTMNADTLNLSSYRYDLYKFYLQTPVSQSAWQFGASLQQRNDFFPVGQLFKQNTLAREANLNGRWNAVAPTNPMRPVQTIAWTFTYRNLRVLAPELSTQKPQETYLGRADYSFSAWKNAVSLNTGYEIGSGQSPKIEFNYLPVNPGQGQYTWIDRNRDSIIQVDEMEIAAFQDQANYVRVAVTTSEYVRTNNLSMNQNLRLDPRAVWGTRKGWRRGMSRFSTQSTLQITRRTYANSDAVQAWNPFQFNIVDTTLVSLSSAIRNVLYFNRADPLWELSLTQGNNGSQVSLTTGFEQRKNNELVLHSRFNFGKHWSLESDLTQGQKKSNNQAFSSRNFDILYREAGPKLSWLPGRSFRVVLNAKYRDSRNQLASGEKALQSSANTELTWTPAAKANLQGFKAATSLRAKGTFTKISYNGTANTAVAFTMLDGLQNGKNFLWNLTLDRQLSKSMQLSLNYEGRKTG
ncbi:MAG: hypothetical protein WCR52_21775, partial [Bacteroidota bacterium]